MASQTGNRPESGDHLMPCFPKSAGREMFRKSNVFTISREPRRAGFEGSRQLTGQADQTFPAESGGLSGLTGHINCLSCLFIPD